MNNTIRCGSTMATSTDRSQPSICGQLGWREQSRRRRTAGRRGRLLVAAENGRDAVRGRTGRAQAGLHCNAGVDVADAATGAGWQRAGCCSGSKGLHGIRQCDRAAAARRARLSRRAPAGRCPRTRSTIMRGWRSSALPMGDWRFWLVTDDGHRSWRARCWSRSTMRRPRHDKSPATSAGLSNVHDRRRP